MLFRNVVEHFCMNSIVITKQAFPLGIVIILLLFCYLMVVFPFCSSDTIQNQLFPGLTFKSAPEASLN